MEKVTSKAPSRSRRPSILPIYLQAARTEREEIESQKTCSLSQHQPSNITTCLQPPRRWDRPHCWFRAVVRGIPPQAVLSPHLQQGALTFHFQIPPLVKSKLDFIIVFRDLLQIKFSFVQPLGCLKATHNTLYWGKNVLQAPTDCFLGKFWRKSSEAAGRAGWAKVLCDAPAHSHPAPRRSCEVGGVAFTNVATKAQRSNLAKARSQCSVSQLRHLNIWQQNTEAEELMKNA